MYANSRLKCLSIFVIAIAIASGLTQGALADPKIRVVPSTFDFGHIPEGEDFFHRYWVANDGSDTLAIQEVKPQCGCTTVPLPSDRLAPSDSVPLDLRFDSKNMRGRVNKAVRIWSNDSTQYPAELFFTAIVADSAPPVIVEPPVASLTSIVNPQQDLILHNNSEKTYQVSFGVEPPQFLNCTLSTQTLPPGESLTLSMAANDKAPLGEYETSVTVHLTANAPTPVTIPVRGVGYMQ